MPLFPIVPFVHGVPAVYRNAANIINTATVLTQDILTAISFFTQQNNWGIYLDGIPVVTADNVPSFDFKRSFVVSDYPIEPNGFETYNKVSQPFECRIRFSAGGSELDRQALLDSVDFICDDLNLYDFVTPEATYNSVNVTHYDYRRTATNGAGLLVVDVWGKQIRVEATADFSSTNTLQQSQSATGSQSSVGGPGNVNVGIRPIKDAIDPGAASRVSNGNVLPSTSAPYTGPIY